MSAKPAEPKPLLFPGAPWGWLEQFKPTAEQINALPRPLFEFICDLETEADPAGRTRDCIILQEQVDALQKLVRMVAAELQAAHFDTPTTQKTRGTHAEEIDRVNPGLMDTPVQADWERYAQAEELVHQRHKKYDLVNLVNWLLVLAKR